MANQKNIVIKVKYPSQKDREREIDPNTAMVTEWNVKRIAAALATVILIISLLLYFVLSGGDTDDGTSTPPEQAMITKPAENIAAPPEPSKDSGSETAPAEQNKEPDQPLQFKLSEAGKVVSDQTMDQIKETIKNEKSVAATKERTREPQLISGKNTPVSTSSNKVKRTLLAGNIINKEPVHILSSPIRVTQSRTVWINYFTELKDMKGETVFHEWITRGKVAYKHRISISSDRWRAATRKPFNHTSGGQWQVRTVDAKGRMLDRKEFTVIVVR